MSEKTLHKGLMRPLLKLLHDEEGYGKDEYEMRREIINRITGDECAKVLIFGCGNIGYETYVWLKCNRIKPVAFIDNDKRLWDKSIDSIPVINPNTLNEEMKKNIFLVANEKYAKQISKQLVDTGVNKGNIYAVR